MGKKHYDFSLEESTIKEFKAYIIRKTGDLKKGDVSKWLEVIIKNSIREEKQQQHTTYNPHGMSKEEGMISSLTDLMKQIKHSLWWDKNPVDISCGNTCHEKILKNIIGKIQGNDWRTRKKWFDRFIEFKFIIKMPNDSNLYRILNDGHNYLAEKEPKQEIESKPEPTQISIEQKNQEFDSVILQENKQ